MHPPLRAPVTALHPGSASASVLRLTEPLSLWGGTHPDGTISDPRHPQFGERLTDRIVLVTGGRGSSSSASVLAELLRAGKGPAGLVLTEPDGILLLGALVAAELYGIRLPIALVTPTVHLALPDTGQLTLVCHSDAGELEVPAWLATGLLRTAVTDDGASDDGASDGGGTAALRDVELSDADRAMIEGSRGPGVAFAMRLVVALARAVGAAGLLSVSRAHVDGCLYHGSASLDLAQRLVELGARVAVPTTSNVGSVDLLHPELVRDDTGERASARTLMETYALLGCQTTYTCAPYQDPGARPDFGEHVAWAESNAIAFVNAVVGARTDRYGDFIDIAAAITGRAPAAGLHLDGQRRADVVVDVTRVDPVVLGEDAGWGVLGLFVGRLVGTRVPVVVGAPPDTTEDQLKAFGAAAASAGGVGMFHVVGVTPEAPTLAAALATGAVERVEVGDVDLRDTRDALSGSDLPPLDAVSLGTPHFSIAEFARLAALLDGGDGFHRDVDVYVSTSRAVLAAARREGTAQLVERAGATIVVDTCTYVTTILSPAVRHVATNSAKWAWYAPANLGVEVSLLTLSDCVDSARAGHLVHSPHRWGGR